LNKVANNKSDALVGRVNTFIILKVVLPLFCLKQV
jgi:hypothetical protein